MDLYLENKTVIVTGASKGLGKAIAMELAKEDAFVFISSRTESTLKEAAKEIIETTGNENVHYVTCDMKDKNQIERLINEVKKKRETVDVLINNAGGPPAGGFLDMDEADWYHAFEQNLLSVVRMTKAVIPYMKKQQEGRIVNITSSSIKQSIDQLILSNTMRPGVLGLTKSLAQEFAPYNILVNTVGPGMIETDRTIELNRAWAKEKGIDAEELMKEATEKIPMKRYGQPDEFAKMVVFLASGANTYITGQGLVVDGALVKAL
ncbi:SDR family oxidoreductase [Virgibacillus sp. W0430]|uniref:SDR family oxidoreductase n=1 Tax=Virgibacillus sp. W0430 TaxID=3391580 RepID=UPI003F44F8E0